MQSALLGLPERARVTTRLAAPELITAELAEQLRDELREFTRLDGFEFRPGATPWFGAPLRTREQARAAVDKTVTLGARNFVKPVPPGDELRLPTTVVPYLLPVGQTKKALSTRRLTAPSPNL